MLMLVDSHIHLSSYPAADRAAILQRARDAGVTRFLSMTGHDDSATGTADPARHEDGLLLAIGIHPRRVAAADIASVIEGLRRLAQLDSVIAIGEIGLDDGTPVVALGVQETFFAAQLELAQELQLPVALHVVGFHERAIKMLRQTGIDRAVVHYFQGDWTLAQAYLDLGLYISVGKPA